MKKDKNKNFIKKSAKICQEDKNNWKVIKYDLASGTYQGTFNYTY